MRLACTIFLLLILKSSHSQDSLVVLSGGALPIVEVTALHVDEPVLTLPAAISLIDVESWKLNLQNLSVGELLAPHPGLFVQNEDNFAQDIRLSIRGFGARAAFGIRGITILTDGFAETTPDGQSQSDNLDPAMFRAVQVIRSPASILAGNAGGGIIRIKTLVFDGKTNTTFSGNGGSFGFQKYTLAQKGSLAGKANYHLFGSYTSQDGFREHSRFRHFLLNGGVKFPLDTTAGLKFIFNYTHSPLAEDPGSLTKESAREDRMAANGRNVTFDAGERVMQNRVGLETEKQIAGIHTLRARIFYTWRDFDNKLPFENGGIVDLNRHFYGMNLAYKFENTFWQALLGFSSDYQKDRRVRFVNNDGSREEKTLDQDEIFFNNGLFTLHRVSLSDRLDIRGGIRLDFIKIEARDKFLTDGDDSGSRHLEILNPQIGISYAWLPRQVIYGNFSTAFETPVLSELSANPAGSGGLNEALKSQFAYNYELGLKGLLFEKIEYELALFHIDITDELVPYELSGFPGRTFFSNAASSTRNGIEAGLKFAVRPAVEILLNHTVSDFYFKNFEIDGVDYSGNKIPGLPDHFSYMALRYDRQPITGLFQLQYFNSQFADNANTERVAAYWRIDLGASYGLDLDAGMLFMKLGIRNLLDADYYSNIRLNAFGSRYYEPAPGIHFYGGLTLELN